MSNKRLARAERQSPQSASEWEPGSHPDAGLRLFGQRGLLYRSVKRCFDFVLASVALVVLSPILLVVALIIYIDDPHGNPFYLQDRGGKNGVVFRIVKFRSMYANADQIKDQLMDKNEMSGPVFKIKDDPRVTRVGRFIRKTSIDELPQLVNVWLGQMSLVGPRPLPIKEARAVTGIGKMRELVKPGITCIWQVSGRNEVDFDEWMEMDAEYVRKQSLLFDLVLLCKTVPAVLTNKGAS